MKDEVQSQPFLPRVGMIWFFIVVTIVAVAMGVVRAAEQGRSLAAAMMLTLIFMAICACISSMCFLAAYVLGAIEKALADQPELPANPFSDGSLPEQIIPPNPVDGN